MSRRLSSSSIPIKWAKINMRSRYGVVTGGDAQYEWMLKWWWRHYTKHNTYPVTFADFGMSKEMCEWCTTRGRLINLRFQHRCNWFKKPLAILGCSSEQIIWVDLDCEIRGDLMPVFDYAKRGFAVTLDPHNPWVKSKHVVASGVVGTTFGCPLTLEWAEACMLSSDLRGDQEVLNRIIMDPSKWKRVSIMPPEYQWLRIDGDTNPNALIMHWTGARGKAYIRNKMGLPRLAHNINVSSGAGRSKRKLRSLLNASAKKSPKSKTRAIRGRAVRKIERIRATRGR